MITMKKIIKFLMFVAFFCNFTFCVSAAQIDTSSFQNDSNVIEYVTIGGNKVARSSMLSQAGADWDQSVIAKWRVPEANVLILDMVEGITSQWSAQTRTEFTTLVVRGVNPDHANLIIGVGLTAIDGVINAEQLVYSTFLAEGISNSVLKLEKVSIEELKYLPKEAHNTIAAFLKENEAIGVWRLSLKFEIHPSNINVGQHQTNIRTNYKSPAEQTREWIGLSQDIYQLFRFHKV